MKILIVFLSVACFINAAPSLQKPFHEHFTDFLNVINENIGDKLQLLSDRYNRYLDFVKAIEFLRTQNLRDLVFEIESLPEFNAVLGFLDRDNIDVNYFIEAFNDAIDNLTENKESKHPLIGGGDFNLFIQDIIATFPKDQLSRLYDQKIKEDLAFRSTVDKLHSEEWKQLWDELLESPSFQEKVKILEEYGIDIDIFIDELLALFGQVDS